MRKIHVPISTDCNMFNIYRINFHTFLSCQEMNKTTTNLKITWQRIPTDGLTGNLQKGVSASYAAISHDKLLVAGGCNFPDKLGFEGGVKVYLTIS
jgi:N-acetylneuraminic acid mutarotase